MWRLERDGRFIELYPSIKAYSEKAGKVGSVARRGKPKDFTFADTKARNAAMAKRAAELVADGWTVVRSM